MPEFTRTQRALLGVSVGVALAALLLSAAVRGCRPEPTLVVASASGQMGEAPGTRTVTVHVKGAVAAPGVYELRGGSRVRDAISVAGGALSTADPDQVNLAAFLSDGQQVYLPARAGSQAAASAPASAASAGQAKAQAPRPAPAPGHPVSLNRATAEELASLPGIGPVLAERIVQDRMRNGPFRNLRQLDRVEGIGPSKVEALLPYIGL